MKSVHIDRPELRQRFQDGLAARVTVVEAPAGFGKTTVMRSWQATVEAEGLATDWISLETSNEGALKALDAYVSGQMPGGGPGDGAKACLFLDDIQEAGKPEKDLLLRLVQGARPYHIVLGTRDAGDVPLARMRLSNEVSDFSVEDLKFSHEEAMLLLGDVVSPDVADEYFEYSEGWAAALNMMRRSLIASDGLSQPVADRSGRPDLADYLNEQFLAGLSPDVQNLLIDLAHLSEFNGDLADHIREKDGSWAMLTDLASGHSLVFEQAREDGIWFRCHQLMRDYLIWKQKELGEARIRVLHRRSAVWLARRGRTLGAIRHAIHAGDPDLAEETLLNAGGLQIGMREGSLRLAALLEQIPNATVYASPRLSLARAYLHLKNGRHHEAALLIDDVRSDLDVTNVELGRDIVFVEAHLRLYRDQHLSEAQVSALEFTAASTPPGDLLTRGILYNFLCLFHHQAGGMERARHFANKAIDLYQELGDRHLQYFMHLHLSTIDLDEGKYIDAQKLRGAAIHLQRRYFTNDPGLKAIADIFDAEITFEGAEPETLAAQLKGALEAADGREGWSELYLAGYETAFAIVARDEGYARAIDILEQAEKMIARRDLPRFSRQIRILELELAIQVGEEADAKRLAAGLRRVMGADNGETHLRWRGRYLGKLALAHYETQFGDLDLARELLHELIADFQASGLLRYLARAHALLLINAAAREDKAEAVAALTQTVALSAQGAFIGALKRVGDGYSAAARWTIRECGISAFDSAGLSTLAKILWALGANQGQETSILSELLSQKEQDVLRGIAEGRANKVIARDMDVSEATIKFHAQNIYRKLGVNSRKLAAEVARQHGLITG
ncbi:LuxR family transcriptional regulator [Phaeobacter inhibens]|uniref:LuxR C-terminal-related transcriptional regulator n=1 Tax=Phaeobacter inhibens TaxID=221822 RepID=UPI002754B41B|nr:LuxR C-terminal-related transcriptional regulator [Phaeobacter inhibens]GLO68505.1 LuxR family transcriptional regulator [Phaeobacter inhibens]